MILDISGIQKYIFDNMTVSSSCEDIHRRSTYVEKLSYEIFNRIKSDFSTKHGFMFGNVSSGKISCGLSCSIDINELNRYLLQLQRAVFASSDGCLSFFYYFCEAYCVKQKKYIASKMQIAQTVISKELEYRKLSCRNLLETDMVCDVDRGLMPDSLVKAARTEKVGSQKAQAAVKLDLDNLGALFHKIIAFDKMAKISRSLNKIIAECIENDQRIKPIFAGGDDIFFVCDCKEYLSVVSQFYRNLHQKLLSNQEFSGYAKNDFGISAGVSIIRKNLGDIPLILYSEKAENALKTAKNKGGKNCICVELSNTEHRITGWSDFCNLYSIYEKFKDKLFLNSTVNDTDLADIKWLKEWILKFAKFNKKLFNKQEVKSVEEIKL